MILSRRRVLLSLRLVLLVILVLVAVWGYRVAYHGQVVIHLLQSRLATIDQLATGGALPSQADIEGLERDLATLTVEGEILRHDLGPILVLAQGAEWVPLIGADIQATPHLLDVGVNLAEAGKFALQALRPLRRFIVGGKPQPSESLGEILVTALDQARPALATAQEYIASARAARAKIRGQSFHTPIGRYVERLDHYLPLLEYGVRGVLALPDALGSSRPRTYLVLAQNSDELRATGGFISSIGTITIHRGQVTHLELRDSYAVDNITLAHPTPPAPLIRYMRIGVLLLRDVNWWPDFPTTAQWAENLWALDQQQEVDGVIAFDLEGIRLLMEALGPISVEGEEQPIDATGFIQALRRNWAPAPGQALDDVWWVHRKDFMSALAKAGMAKLQQGTIQDMLHLVRSLKAAVEGKHLLIYSNDLSLRLLLAEMRADGSVLPTQGDYLLIVDSNMGFNKVNPRIQQYVEYAVELKEDGRSRARLAISYEHKGTTHLDMCIHEARYGRTYEDMMERCYWDYVRVYTPLGSTPILGQMSPELEIAQDGDKGVLATFFVLAPGATQEIVLDYLLPLGIVQRGTSSYYSLLVQKQPGTSDLPLRIALSLPQGVQLRGARPQPTAIEGRTVIFQAVLDRDRTFEVIYGP